MLAYLGEEMDPHIDACPDCRARRAEYQRIALALAQESPRPLPAGWMEDLRAKLESRLIAKRVTSSSPGMLRVDVPPLVPPLLAPRRPRSATGKPAGSSRLAGIGTRWWPTRLAGGGALIMAAAMALILAWPGPRADVEMQIVRGPVQYRGAEEAKHTGDVLQARGRAGDADRFELRIYLDGTRLVFRCPGGAPPDCGAVDDGVVVSYAFPAPGRYEVVWICSDSAIADPVGSLDADLNAAREAGATAESEMPIDVD